MLKILLMCLFSTSLWAGDIVPFVRDEPRVSEFFYITSTGQDSNFFRTAFGFDHNDAPYFRGFSMLNIGPNKIVPTAPIGMDYANREYFLGTLDQAKRDTHLWITDYPGTGVISDYFESMLVFFPRKSQQYITETQKELIMTLTTGEDVIFLKEERVIIGGVLSEGTMDYNPNRLQRKFAEISYSGEGLMIRANSKGSDPRLGKTAQISKKGLPVCNLPVSDFWTQEGHPKFKFVTDEEAYAHISKKCGAEYIPTI